ncbi:putative reverse transcriptase domain-containing protein [Tanacetum coccineum]
MLLLLMHVVPHSGFIDDELILIRPGEDIPIGRLYRTHPGGPCRALTARKWVRPLSSHCLALRSPVASVPLPTHDSRSIAHTLANLLPPRKRFIDSYSLEDSGEEHIEVDTIDTEVVADVGLSDGVVAHAEDSIGMRVKIVASDVREDDEEFEAEAIHYMSEVCINRITKIEITQRQLEASQLVASGERASLVERIGSLRLYYLKVFVPFVKYREDRVTGLRWSIGIITGGVLLGSLGIVLIFRRNMTITPQLLTLKNRRTLLTDELRNVLAFMKRMLALPMLSRLRIKCQNSNDGDIGNGRDGNGRDGNGENGNGKNGNPNENNKDARPGARDALTWWNSHKRTIRAEAAFSMLWRELMKLMTEVYCPRNKIQKMESELWNLTMKNNDLAAYTQRFQELTMMCTKMVPEEEDRVEKFIGGLPTNIPTGM